MPVASLRLLTGRFADHSNRTIGIVAAALTAAVIVPPVLALRPSVEARA
jgi:FSR family fosmidomycin resistance protein-like MFS transporter